MLYQEFMIVIPDDKDEKIFQFSLTHQDIETPLLTIESNDDIEFKEEFVAAQDKMRKLYEQYGNETEKISHGKEKFPETLKNWL